MDNLVKDCKDNTFTLPSMSIDFHSESSNTQILDKLFSKLDISIPENVGIDNITCLTATGLVEGYIKSQCVYLCSQSEISFKQIAYEEIHASTKKIAERRDFYTSVSDLCSDLYYKHFSDTSKEKYFSCPIDNTIEFRNDILWIKNISSATIVWNKPITTLDQLLPALSCKFEFLSQICNKIIDVRKHFSNDKKLCAQILYHHQQEHCGCISVSAQKCIDEQDTSAKRKKYPAKVVARMKKNPLYEKYSDLEYNFPEFAYFVANKEGISNGIVFDFLTDYEITRRLNIQRLSYPWLKESYYNRIEAIKPMLLDAYKTCTSPGLHLSVTQSYTIIWFWLINYLKIADSGIDNAIPMYVELMNNLSGNIIKVSSIQTEVSQNKKTDYSSFFDVLRHSAIINCILPFRQIRDIKKS